ncbi:hypothetical protein BLOT_000238 [Blomia tropicalis]|nr:hypothetical protein BLOT_000238 [Blomia tropicalis]
MYGLMGETSLKRENWFLGANNTLNCIIRIVHFDLMMIAMTDSNRIVEFHSFVSVFSVSYLVN